MKKLLVVPSFVVLALALVAGTAAADKKDKERADSLFKQGKKLMAEKRYSEACQAFEESFKLDAGIGGELNVAKCYEEWGKLRRAYRAYQQADQMAKDANDPREPKIAELVAKIEPDVPRLTIKLPTGAAPQKLTVLVDGEEIEAKALGKSRHVDPGPHTIEWTADDAPRQTKVVAVGRGGDSELVLELPHEAAVVPVQQQQPVEPRHEDHDVAVDRGRSWRIAAYVSGIGGVALMGVSTALAVSAKSQYSNALKADCGGQTDMCDPTGLTLTHDARSKANVATGLFIGGVAVVGVGVALYVLAPRATHGEHALRVVPHVDGRSGGLAVDGRF